METINQSKPYKAVFGYDIFISYSRKDGLDYAYSIAQFFMKKGYECYIDQLSSISPGKELPSNIKNAVVMSTSFVLIGSEGAQQSEAIKDEIILFLKNNKNKPLIPITIDGSINEKAIWYERIAGLALINENKFNLINGTPSKAVTDRIENALIFTKKSTRLRRIAGFIMILALGLFGLIAFQFNKVAILNDEKNLTETALTISKNDLSQSKNNLKEVSTKNQGLQRDILTAKEGLASLDSSLLEKGIELNQKEKALNTARANIKRLAIETKNNFLIGQAAKSMDKNANQTLAFLKEALKTSNDPRLLSIFLNLLENKSTAILDLKLEQKISHIDLSADEKMASVITQDSVIVIDLTSNVLKRFSTKEESLGHSSSPKTKILNDGNIIIQRSQSALLNPQNGQFSKLDTLADSRRHFSRNPKYYLTTSIWTRTSYAVLIDSKETINLNDKFQIEEITDVEISNNGELFSLSNRDSTYICNSDFQILHRLPEMGNITFSGGEYIIGTADEELIIYSMSQGTFGRLKSDKIKSYPKIQFYPHNESMFSTKDDLNIDYWEIINSANSVILKEIPDYHSDILPNVAYNISVKKTDLNYQNNIANTSISIKDFNGKITQHAAYSKGKKIIAGSEYGELKIFDLSKLRPYSFIDSDEANTTGGLQIIKDHLYQFYNDSVRVVDLVHKDTISELGLSHTFRNHLFQDGNTLYFLDKKLALIAFDIISREEKKITSVPITKMIQFFEKDKIIFFKNESDSIFSLDLLSHDLKVIQETEHDFFVSNNKDFQVVYQNKVHKQKFTGWENLKPIELDFTKVERYNLERSQEAQTFFKDSSHLMYLDFDQKNNLILGTTDYRSYLDFHCMSPNGKVSKIKNKHLQNIAFDSIIVLKDEKYYYPTTLENLPAVLFLAMLSPILDISQTSSGQLILLNSKHSNKAVFWEVKSNKYYDIALDKKDEIQFFKFLKKSKKLLVSAKSGVIYTYDLKNKQVTKLADAHSQIDDILRSPNEQYFAILDKVDNLNLYAIDGTLIKSFDINDDYRFTFSNDDRFLIIKDDQKFITFWPLAIDLIGKY